MSIPPVGHDANPLTPPITTTTDQYSPDSPRYPEVYVQLAGQDGNAFAIMGRVTDALEAYMRDELEASHTERSETKQQYRDEAMSGDYDHLLRVTMCWVNCLGSL